MTPSGEPTQPPASTLITQPDVQGDSIGERAFPPGPLSPTAPLTPEKGVRYGPERMDRLRTMLGAANTAMADSMRRALERHRAATNWTWSRRDGARVGVSPGRLHLGLFELPIPIGGSMSLRDFDPHERARRQMLAELREQADRFERDSIIADAISALRRRRAAGVESPR